jgi:hypothetical protein
MAPMEIKTKCIDVDLRKKEDVEYVYNKFVNMENTLISQADNVI